MPTGDLPPTVPVDLIGDIIASRPKAILSSLPNPPKTYPDLSELKQCLKILDVQGSILYFSDLDKQAALHRALEIIVDKLEDL